MSEFEVPGKASRNVLSELKQVIGKSNYAGLFGISITGGEGDRIIDADGNSYIDCLTGASANILGYGSGIEKVYAAQAKKMQHSGFSYSPNRPAIQLAKQLIDLTPGDFSKKVLFGLSGSDACGGAIEAMRKYTRKFGVISFKNDYHGTTGLSQPASYFHSYSDGIYNPQPSDFPKHIYPVTEEQKHQTLKEIEKDLSSGHVGGVLMETIQGDAGVLLPTPGFIVELKEMLEQYNALLIVDEVQTGMGRTGYWWAIEHEEIVPDLIVTAKGLSAGYAPISAIVGREDVIDSLFPGQEVFTFTGHAPSTSLVTEVIHYIKRNNLVDRSAQKGQVLKNKLQEVQQQYPEVIKEVRGRGLMIGMEINQQKQGDEAKVFAMRGVEKGIYFGYFGKNDEVVRIEPPLIIKDESIDQIVEVTAEVASEMKKGHIPKKTVQKIHEFSSY